NATAETKVLTGERYEAQKADRAGRRRDDAHREAGTGEILRAHDARAAPGRVAAADAAGSGRSQSPGTAHAPGPPETRKRNEGCVNHGGSRLAAARGCLRLEVG